MIERPIIFSAPMVRAILAGMKSQTRRIVRPQPRERPFQLQGPFQLRGEVTQVWLNENRNPRNGDLFSYHWRCPYGIPGDHLWVRETFGRLTGNGVRVVYRADGDPPRRLDGSLVEGMKWSPAIYLPRWASRILLEVTAVRVERLQEISEEDARAEGVEQYESDGPIVQGPIWNRCRYENLWDHLHRRDGHGWQTNPRVWVVEFRRVDGGPNA